MKVVKRIIQAAKSNLKRDTKAWKYLRSRGVTEKQIGEYDLGCFSEDEWPPYVDEGESEEGDRYRDWSARGVKLKNQIVFPLRNALGQSLGFMLRNPDISNRGYREFRVRRAKACEVFFGIREAVDVMWKTGKVYLVEGHLDLFPVRRVFAPTLCVGTAELDPDQCRFLRRIVDEVYFLFDNDYQGQEGYETFAEEQQENFNTIERIHYRGDDPSAAWEMHGEDQFKEHLKSSLDPLGLGLGDTSSITQPNNG